MFMCGLDNDKLDVAATLDCIQIKNVWNFLNSRGVNPVVLLTFQCVGDLPIFLIFSRFCYILETSWNLKVPKKHEGLETTQNCNTKTKFVEG